MSIYKDAEAIYTRLAGLKNDTILPNIQLAHYPTQDTELAAALATMEIPFREPAPLTDEISETTGKRRRIWWLGDISPHEYAGGPRRTDELTVCWSPEFRARFAKDFPLHPLNAMHAAIDARSRWLKAMNTCPDRLAARFVGAPGSFATDSLREASILIACRFECLGFTGRAFVIRDTHLGVHAQDVLKMALAAEGASPAQWMHKVLVNLDAMLKLVKSTPAIVTMREGDSTLFLREDATKKTVDRFHALLP